MNRPIHFEIPAEKPERAIEFYEKVFGGSLSGGTANGVLDHLDGRRPTRNQRRPDDTAGPGAALCKYDGRRES